MACGKYNKFRMMTMAMVMCLSLLGMAQAYTDDSNNDNTAEALNHLEPQMPLPTYRSVSDLCRWLCEKDTSAGYKFQCPPSCERGLMGMASKRAPRGRRYDDFRFDDYLFMKLLGRNLEEGA